MNIMKQTFPRSLATLTFVLITANPAYALFKCVDEKGVTHYGDVMPAQCAKKPVVEMSQQGSVMRRIDAPLTQEQLTAIEEDKVRNKAKTDLMAAQKLRDNALISTYGSEREFDVARDKDIATLESRRKSLIARIDGVDKQLAKLNNDLEFYQAGKSTTSKAKEVPPQLLQDQKRAASDAAANRAEIEKIEKGKEELRKRYDDEKSRWKRLKTGMPAGTLLDEQGQVAVEPEIRSQIVGQSQIIPGRPRGIATCLGKVYECTLGIVHNCKGPNVGGPGVNQLAIKCMEDKR